MNKTTHSILTKVIIGNIVNGIAWILVGITSIKRDIPFLIASLIALIIVIITAFLALTMKFEEDDEMSAQHYTSAKASAYTYLIIILATLYSISGVLSLADISLTLDWRVWITFIIGFIQIAFGIRFCKLEKDGDE